MGNGVLVVMVGPAGCGKTSWAKSLNGFEVVSSDAIRAEIFGDENAQFDPKRVFGEAYNRARGFLDEGKSVVFDATNCRPMYRKNVLYELGAHAGYVVGIVYKGSLEICLSRNLQRDRKVPEKVIKGMFYGLSKEPPTIGEGFDALVKLDDASKKLVEFLNENRMENDPPEVE